MWIIVALCLTCILGLLGVLLLWSPGKPGPILGPGGRLLPGSVSEKIRVPINGVEQGMFIVSKDTTYPVLLYLHGGPGMPTYFLNQQYPTGLEEYFTVCWWEQRGTGLSYSSDVQPETMTVDQFIADAVAVTDYLRHRFGKERIFLMGHSWGSFIGIQAAARAPELYHAYIGVAQMSDQLKSERLAYEYMMKLFGENGDRDMVKKVSAAPPGTTVPLPEAWMSVRDEAMHALGIGTTHDMRSVISGIFLPVWQERAYTLGEKVNIWRGKWSDNSRNLWNQMMATNITIEVLKLDIPVYFFHGIYDYTVSYTEAKSYFDKMQAPRKGFYTFDQSAHSPIFEEPEKTRRILKEDVLAGAVALADP
jgi:pimeloyl-ACP methyl ester carboxylesterase